MTKSRGFGPATIEVDRNWSIPETTKIGTIVKTVHVQSDNNKTIVYSLEPDELFGSDIENPFWIDPNTGYVYLNKSLEGRVRLSLTSAVDDFIQAIIYFQANQEPFILNVGAFDGSYTVKNQVRVSFKGINENPRKDNFIPPKHTFPKLPDFGSLPTPINRDGSGFFFPSTKSSPSPSITKILPTQNRTYIEIEGNQIDDASPTINVTLDAAKMPVSKENTPLIVSPAVIPILIAVIIIFLVAAIIALIIFRKQICRPFGRKFKKSKVDSAKNSNQSTISVITLSDSESRNSMMLQHWQGPVAYNNRYTPWATAPHDGVNSSSSFSYASGELKVPGYDQWEFPRHRLKVFNILGEGAFGQVWRCEATDIDGVEGISTVAVKTLKENAIESEKKDLVSELQVMKSLEPHVNVVRLLGCCTEKDPVFVIIEYVALGKLQTFLRNSRMEKNYNNTSGKSKTLTSQDLVSFMYQVARGMEFLSSRGVRK